MKPRLLIAERDVEFCDLLQCFFSDRGYEVESAADALQCVAKIRCATPVAVVLDLELLWGGADGVLHWLREERGASSLPVIVTATAGVNPEIVADFDPPVIRFLPKPFLLSALLECIRSAVAERHHQEPFDWRPEPASEKRFG